MVNYLIIGIGYAFASVMQPGPFQAFLLSQSLTNGWRKTIPMVFAPLLSDGPVVILVLFVLTNVPHELLRILQCAGGVLLLYLAFGAYRTWRTFDQRKEQKVSSQQNVLKAAMVNLLNPAPYLGWSLIIGPLLLKGWQENPANGMALVIGFYGTMILSSIGMVVLFAVAGNLGPRVSRTSVGISAIALGVFGIYQLWSGVIAQ